MAEKTPLEIRIEAKAALYSNLKQGGLTQNPLKAKIANALAAITGIGAEVEKVLKKSTNAVIPVVTPPADGSTPPPAVPIPDFALWYAQKTALLAVQTSIQTKEASIIAELNTFRHYSQVNSGEEKPIPNVDGEPAGLAIVCSVISAIQGFYASVGETNNTDFTALLLGSLTGKKPEIEQYLTNIANLKVKANLASFTVANTAANITAYNNIIKPIVDLTVDFKSAINSETAEFLKAQATLQDNLTLEVAMSGNPTFEVFKK